MLGFNPLAGAPLASDRVSPGALVLLSGVQSSALVSAVTVPDQDVIVGGFDVLSSVGVVTVAASAQVSLSGVSAQCPTPHVFVWGPVPPTPTPDWTTLEPSATPKWSEVAPSPTPDWTKVAA